MTTKHKLGFVLTAFILMITVAACGGGGGAASAGKPEDAAKAFFDAVFAGKDVSAMICTSAKSQADAMKTALSSMASKGATIDTSGLTYTASNVSGDAATVTVGGNLKITVAGTTTSSPLPPQPIPMKNESGWKVCG